MSKHTPEPWIGFVGEDAFTVVPAMRPGQIATIFKAGDNGANADANSRLIAAAPELLASLKEAVRLYENYALLANPEKCSDDLHAGRWVNNARAAIAKSEGKTE